MTLGYLSQTVPLAQRPASISSPFPPITARLARVKNEFSTSDRRKKDEESTNFRRKINEKKRRHSFNPGVQYTRTLFLFLGSPHARARRIHHVSHTQSQQARRVPPPPCHH